MRIVMLLLLASLLAGCLAKSTSNYTRSPDGVIKASVTVIGTGDKVSEVAAEGLFADEDGAGVAKSNASQQSSGIAESLQAFAQALAIGMNIARGDSSFAVGTGGVGATPTLAGNATDNGLVAYSDDGFEGAAVDSVGVYGRPSCGRCQTYLKNNPGTQLINLDQGSNSAEMWKALRALGFKGNNVQLPVRIATDSYEEMAR